MGFIIFNPFPSGTTNNLVGSITVDSLQESPTALTMGATNTITLDVSVKNDFNVVLNTSTTGNTITLSNPSDGRTGTIFVKTSLANQSITFVAGSGTWTILTEVTSANTNPSTGSGTFTIFSYTMRTLASVNYIIINKAQVA